VTEAIIALRARQEEAERLAGHLVEQWPGAAQLCQAVAEVHAEALAIIEAAAPKPKPKRRGGKRNWTPEQRAAAAERMREIIARTKATRAAKKLAQAA
jgi:hypothetical protein